MSLADLPLPTFVKYIIFFVAMGFVFFLLNFFSMLGLIQIAVTSIVNWISGLFTAIVGLLGLVSVRKRDCGIVDGKVECRRGKDRL